MRIWSIHPKYLDVKGLVALWRETLLAKHVLAGKTKGYKNHPQLNRFKELNNPVDGINQYLSDVFNEAEQRGYHFDKTKIDWTFSPITTTVTRGQISFEINHLLNKLKDRDVEYYQIVVQQKEIVPHPQFKVVDGDIESWEKI